MRKLSAWALVVLVWSLVILTKAPDALSENSETPLPSVVNIDLQQDENLAVKPEAAEKTLEKNSGPANRDSDNKKNINSKKPAAPPAKPKKPVQTAKAGRTLTVTAYAYCINGRTASGAYTSKGCIAVDPRVIPMGSKIYIPGYGWGKAMDTGGSVKGNVIDVWFPSNSECMQWGVRTVKITVE